MRDLQSFASMKLKAALFLAIGLISGALLLLETLHWRTALLLALCIWAFCRCYYFAFYVIEKYVDPTFKFSGLGSAFIYLVKKRKHLGTASAPPPSGGSDS